jgi:type IV pilus assembly protein PilY1
MSVIRLRSVSFFARALCLGVMLAASFGAWAVIAPNDPPDLSSAPPDTSLGVNPNIFVSFDDSGSMQQTVMGDFPPLKSNTLDWAGPWRCANVIDPDHSATAADKKMRAIAMNGVYYNPSANNVYAPPLKEDGQPFALTIDSTLQAVFVDGVSVGRPFPTPALTQTGVIAFNNNTDVNGSASDTGRTNLMGKLFVQNGSSATCTGQPGTCSCTGTAGSPSRVCTTDNRWQCGTGAATQNTNSRYTAASPMDGLSHTLSDGTSVVYGPAPLALVGGGGGPYYFRYKLVCGAAGAQPSPNCATAVPLDAYGKPSSAAALTALYTASNWEAVPVPTGAASYGNFANWYAYYRTRNQMARSAMSRVFGVIGTPQKSNIRVTWQNLGNNTNLNWAPASGSSGGTAAPTVNIVELDDNTPYAGPNAAVGNNTWRQAFFNWLFNVTANNGTPSRGALLRAGNYFKRGQGVTNISNPYWQPQGTDGRELACRQNFHLLMTDGLYNQPVTTAPPGTGFNTNTSTPVPANSSGLPGPYSPTAPESKLFADGGWATSTDSDGGSAYSDIAFYYWITNLRPDFTSAGVTVKSGGVTSVVANTDIVPPYFPDLTLGITGSATPTPALDTTKPGATPEVFWNPANDPASWPHLVQFAVTLGAFGNLVNSTNTDCQNGATITNDDGCALRKGVNNSGGATGWPRPNGTGSGIAANIDDLWHAALNARGQFFVATSPQSLITRLTRILSNIVNRSGTQVSESVNSSILHQGSVGYQGGYNSNGWLGYLVKQQLNPFAATDTLNNPAGLALGAPVGLPVWDAGCLLTSGACSATGSPTTLGATPNSTTPAGRIIFTSVGSAGALIGKEFNWAKLGTNEQLALNLDPNTTWPDTTTTLVVNGGVANGTQDGNGSDRLDYIRGVRTHETTPTSLGTSPTTFRPRLSVLGAIIDSAAVYEGGPSAGWQDIYPLGTPEYAAAHPTTGSPVTYEAFVGAYLFRDPMVYVGANDGMLHAFTAGNPTVVTDGGKEAWAYVPHALYANGALDQVGNPSNNGLVATVDDSPIVQDVFIKRPLSASAPQWRTMLIGSMRLGGRGIFALDVTCTPQTAPTQPSCTPATDTIAKDQFMWEFTSEDDPDLGYGYATANIARIRCNTGRCHGPISLPDISVGGTWVVLVTSGDFPICLPAANGSPTCVGNNHSATDNAAGATTKASGPTYLWVLNADDGSQIAKIPVNKSGITTYGLSTPAVVDFGLDQIDDVVVAGDLAGNVWRFDLTDPNPSNWTSPELMFQTYTSNSACSTINPAGFGCEPITVMPVAFPDSSTGSVVYVFGSGQYLGATDNSVSSTYTTQHFFGVRDQGTGSGSYPLHESNLATRTLTQAANGNRSLPFADALNTFGWEIPLNLAGNLGERDVATASPLFSTGVALLTSLIPGQNLDPCKPGRSGAVMAVDASTGGAPLQFLTPANASIGAVVGGIVTNPPTVGGLSLISSLGGGTLVLPGIVDSSGNPLVLNGLTPIWRRTSWNELLNQL